jgi:hypothetical protein
MKCLKCENETKSLGQNLCKKCYDKGRRLKIKNKEWNFNSTPPDELSSVQEQVLIGGLLGDLSLYQYKNQINCGISINRSIKDKEYLEYQFDLFKDFCSSGIKVRYTLDKRTNKTYTGCSFRTQVAEVFSSYKQKWYPNGEKIVPKDLQLTPLICAIWFCDDGSITLKNNKRRISLYTDSFVKDDVLFLKNLIKKYLDIDFSISRKNSMKDISKGFYLYIDHKDNIMKFVKYIQDVFPIGMSRKSDRWKGIV